MKIVNRDYMSSTSPAIFHDNPGYIQNSEESVWATDSRTNRGWACF